MVLKTKDYFEMGKEIRNLGIKTIICQEGGYHMDEIANIVKELLDGLSGKKN